MSRRAAWLIGAAVVVGVLGGAFSGYVAQRHDPGPAVFAEPATVAAQPIRVTYGGNGTFLVPSQVAPGTYMVTAGAGDFGCYWERLKTLSTGSGSVLSHGDASRGAYGRLVVTKADAAVRMVGDCVWVKL